MLTFKGLMPFFFMKFWSWALYWAISIWSPLCLIHGLLYIHLLIKIENITSFFIPFHDDKKSWPTFSLRLAELKPLKFLRYLLPFKRYKRKRFFNSAIDSEDIFGKTHTGTVLLNVQNVVKLPLGKINNFCLFTGESWETKLSRCLNCTPIKWITIVQHRS